MTFRKRTLAPVSLAAIAAACTAIPQPSEKSGQSAPAEIVQPLPAPVPTPVPAPSGPTTFLFDGQLIQGGWIRGQAPAGTVSAKLADTPLALDSGGRFFAAFDRDEGQSVQLTATLGNGRVVTSPLAIAPRDWNIEHVNIARSPGGMTDAFWKIREPELNRINASRDKETGAAGWRQDFIWPVKGRISGRFGSQRIYRGEPGSYHSGLDIAPGAGTPFVAPADGVVVLAAPEGFSLEGKLLIIDHGQGLNSAFLHSQRLDVREGDMVKQGQQLGLVGSTGRATGPHLHWSLKWRDSRLDPLLFLPPQ